MPELGKLTAVFDADTRKFDAGAKNVAAKVIALDANFRGLTGSATSAASTISGFAGPAAIAAGAAVALGAAISGVVVGLFDLVKGAAKAGGELLDLSQKTSFTVETLSGLSIIAKTTGSSIEAISTSLIIFQKNMGAAQDPTSKQGQLFKSLSIDTRDNEKALRQAFTTLAKYGETQKAVEVSTKLFGRSGAAVLAMVKETNGNLDAAMKKYGDLGLIISTGAATASDKFNDLLEVTTLQLQAVTRSIGTQLLPVAIDALESISAGLRNNKDAWAAWGDSIANVLRGLSVIVHSEIGSWIGAIADFSVRWLTIPGLVARGLNALGSSVDRPSADPFGPGGAARGGRAALPGTPEYAAAQARQAAMAASATRAAGGGGGGGGGGGAPKADAGIKLLKQLEEQFKNLTPRTELQRIQDKLLEDQYNHTTDAIKKKIQITAMDIDQRKKDLELTRERIATGIEAREEFQKFVDLVQQSLTRRRSMSDLTGLAFADLGGGSVYGAGEGSTRPRSVNSATGRTRDRVATVDETVMRERIAMIRNQMRNLAGDLTDIFANSIEDGFSKGIKSGLQELSLGLLRIVEDVFLKRMAEGLSQMLGNLATGSGGGSWLSKIPGIILGAFGGSIGGGSSAGGAGTALAGAIHFASGGVVPGVDRGFDSVPAMLRPGETVLPAGQSSGNTYIINLPPAPRGSYVSPKSARQQAELIMAHLQGST